MNAVIERCSVDETFAAQLRSAAAQAGAAAQGGVAADGLADGPADGSPEYECFARADVCGAAVIPRPRGDVICLGVNFAAHAEESARFKGILRGGDDGTRPYPVYFSKRVREAVADGAAIPAYEGYVTQLDYEVELAVIIGRPARNVPREKAFEHVFGYTILNDVSARNLQKRHGQWFLGKSLDGFCPLGPVIVTEDEFRRPPHLSLTSRVNGEVRQHSSTDLMLFDIAYVIEDLSRGMTLESGTIISMGTPAGVGMGFNPPRFMKKGDIVECEIEGIGVLKNIVE